MNTHNLIDQGGASAKTTHIYPNPTTSLITIEGLTEAVTVDIYNLQGTKMGSQRVDENNTIKINHIPAGMYILDIQTKDHRERHKIIKMD